MNTERNQIQDMLKNAAQQKPETVQQQPSQPKSTNKKSRNQTTQNARNTAQEMVENAHVYDSEVSSASFRDAAIHGMSFGQKKVAVFVAAMENTYEAGVKMYLASSANNNAAQSEELDIKGILKESGLDVDALNEELGKQIARANQQLTLPSTQPLFLLSSAD